MRKKADQSAHKKLIYSILKSARTHVCILLVAGLSIGLQAQHPDDLDYSFIEVDHLLEQAARNANLARRIELARRGLLIARDMRYDNGIVQAAVMLGADYKSLNKIDEALQYFLEAEFRLGNSTPKPLQMKVYQSLGELFLSERLYLNARRYYGEALALEPNNELVLEKIADACLYDMRFDSAEYYYKKMLAQSREKGNLNNLVRIYQKLAHAYEYNGNFGKSLYYYLRIEDLIEKNGSPEERAILYNNLGRQYTRLNDYEKALENFRKAELQCQYVKCPDRSLLYANLGIALHNVGKSKEGIEYLIRAGRDLQAEDNIRELANLENLLATVYFSNRDVYNALEHNELAIRHAKATHQLDLLTTAYRIGADMYHDLYDFERAFAYYRAYLETTDSLRKADQIRIQKLNQQRELLNASEGQIKYLLSQQSIRDLAYEQVRLERERLELANENLLLETQRRESELLLLQKQKALDEARQRELILQTLKANQDARIAAQKLETEKNTRLIAELKQKEAIERAQNLAREQELELLTRDKAIADLERSKEAGFRRMAYTTGVLGIALLALLGINWFMANRASRRLKAQNRRIQQQNVQIDNERSKSEKLLRNILPEEIADELKTQGYAEPRFYESATVLFTDFVDFSRLSAQLSPREIIDELDECFLAFDEICEKHGLEKIKTIGDAYMCVAGLPKPLEDHPAAAVASAIQMLEWLEARQKNNPKAIFTQMRIGIHTGPVVAGVIGKNKFAYDIWGDAVNLAARLEEHGEPGQINISKSTWEAIKDRNPCTARGKIAVHNKGEIFMYFVNR
ncbi:MAG: adenylate/guanylate cyclase domain-containing protein [Saprospiraceae bacterium]